MNRNPSLIIKAKFLSNDNLKSQAGVVAVTGVDGTGSYYYFIAVNNDWIIAFYKTVSIVA